MITYLVAGRNDGYGVNLAKRTAISLNYFASLCEGEDDEIIYVDCNSHPDDITLTESIADTLTVEARRRLRTFRISGKQMDSAIGETPLPFSDELSRNVGIRRSNPKNKWLLSTNCDILLQPLSGTFHQLLATLEETYYVCPRIGIPPAQWQALDRANVPQISDFCDRVIAAGVRLPAEREEKWLRFNAIGDFQLAPREQWFAVAGCEEAMKYWGHSDANNARRLSLLNKRDRTPDLSDVIRALHLDHNLEMSSSDQNPLRKNDWKQWIEDVTEAKSTNGENWGLPNVELPEIRLPEGEVDAAAILKANRRQRGLLKTLRLKLLNRFWKKASDAANWTDKKLNKD